MKTLSYKIYSSTKEFPKNWNDFAGSNIFFSSNYLAVLENAAPKNMICHFIGVFEFQKLVGIAITQMVSVANISSFGVNKSCFQSKIRDFVFRNFANNILFIGNNMLTGQNAFVCSELIMYSDFIGEIHKASNELQEIFSKQGKKIHIVNFKDFEKYEIDKMNFPDFNGYYQFEIQPNMVFEIPENWNSNDDYIAALSKKYRDQYKRAHKKMQGVEKRKLSLEEIIHYNDLIFKLYLNVTKNAPFNTFYLSENHFVELKKQLANDFLFYGYFFDDKLVGFDTLIKNGIAMDTYFLGYDVAIQREKMLYLNMLYDMIGYSINKKFKTIIFARTALEIKSSVGAKPMQMFGFIKHNNKIINKFMPILFKYFEPKVDWHERNPFK